jgi:cell division protein FtsB
MDSLPQLTLADIAQALSADQLVLRVVQLHQQVVELTAENARLRAERDDGR